MKVPDEASTLPTHAQVSIPPAGLEDPGSLLLEERLQLRRHFEVTDVSVEEAARGKWTRPEGRDPREKRLPRFCERWDATEGQEGQEGHCRPQRLSHRKDIT